MKKKIVIYGNGKVAKALVCGLENDDRYSLLVIGSREEGPKRSDLSFFEKKGIAVSWNVHDVAHADCIILTVVPAAAGSMFTRLREVQLLPSMIISLVSGLERSRIFSQLQVPDGWIITGTTNTNISQKKGLTVLSKHGGAPVQRFAAELFSGLGIVKRESEENILKSVVSIGSDNGFNGKCLQVLFVVQDQKITLYEWLTRLKRSIETFTTYDESYQCLLTHLQVKEKVLKKVLGYSRKDAENRVKASFMSTLEALIAIGPSVAVKDIQDLIVSVVTPNGCTEKGISRIDSMESILSFERMSGIISDVWRAAQLFPSAVTASLGA